MDKETITIDEALRLAEKVDKWKTYGSDNPPKCFGILEEEPRGGMFSITLGPSSISFFGNSVKSLNIKVEFKDRHYVESVICNYQDLRGEKPLELYERARESAREAERTKEEKSRLAGIEAARSILEGRVE